jgi:hypothetical protein
LQVDKASILAETIAYLKELERRVQDLESTSRERITRPSEARQSGHHSNEIIEKRVSGAKRKKVSELSDDTVREHHWVLSNDGTSNVTVTVTDKDVLLEVHCQWEELLMARVFDAMKTLHLDVLSVEASTPDGFMGLKIRAQVSHSQKYGNSKYISLVYIVTPFLVSRLFKFTDIVVSVVLFQSTSHAATVPRMISETVRKAIGKR